MITLGEFLDELEIGKHINNAFSIYEKDDETTIVDEKLGDDRLGS